MVVKLRLILTLLLCALLFSSCGTRGGGDSIFSAPLSSIIGRWETPPSFDAEIFIEFREDGTFTTNLKVYHLSQDNGIYTIEKGVLHLYYVSKNEVDAQINSLIQQSPTSDSIYLYKVLDNKLYLAMRVGYDPDRGIDDLIAAQDENLLYFDRAKV